MRSAQVVQAFTVAFACAALASGQGAPATVRDFSRANVDEKTAVLVQIIRHKLADTPENMAAIISAALGDSEARVREGALAAVTSRAAGAKFVRGPAARSDWAVDRPHMQALRPLVVECLKDPSEDVRLEAITALVSLDYNPDAPGLEVTPETASLLLQRFRIEPSAMIRATIIAGFGTKPLLNSGAVREALIAAFHDPDHRVRHAATSAVDKFDADAAVALLVGNLKDDDRTVRGQSAALLAKFAPQARPHLSEIQRALDDEQDPQVRELLQLTVSAIRRDK